MHVPHRPFGSVSFRIPSSSVTRRWRWRTARRREPANPKQPVDEAYTAKLHKYTTESFFTSPLVEYLPASENVPTPEVVLGDVAGAPGILPYAEDVYKYMGLLEKASPRVKVFSIGTTEEGREMIAVAISSEANLKNLDANKDRLARLGVIRAPSNLMTPKPTSLSPRPFRLLHHRHDSLAGNRRAYRVDGTSLPVGCR